MSPLIPAQAQHRLSPPAWYLRCAAHSQVFPAVNRAILLRVVNDTALAFGEVLSLPGGQSKFALVWDAVSAAFVSLVNVNVVLPLSPHAGVYC